MRHEATVEGVGVSVDESERGVPTALVHARDELLPILISPSQAQAIQHALEGIPLERPFTHDLLVEMVTDFGGSIDRVRIDDLADGTFYAKIDVELFRDGDRTKFVYDARPSDGIALALRVNCPIEVETEVLDVAGHPPEEFDVEGLDLGTSEDPTTD
ncbi:MAG: bifunctional nuclease family protein [Halobacteriales archaeon]